MALFKHVLSTMITNDDDDAILYVKRQLFCWMDQWYGMSIEDIRDLEEQIKKDLDVQRKEGPAVVVPSPSDSASIASSSRHQ